MHHQSSFTVKSSQKSLLSSGVHLHKTVLNYSAQHVRLSKLINKVIVRRNAERSAALRVRSPGVDVDPTPLYDMSVICYCLIVSDSDYQFVRRRPTD